MRQGLLFAGAKEARPATTAAVVRWAAWESWPQAGQHVDMLPLPLEQVVQLALQHRRMQF